MEAAGVAPSPRVTDYAAWCAARGLDPHHPERWPDEAWAAYVEALRVLVRPDEEPADWQAGRDRRWWPPARRSPWAVCPCHQAFGNPLRDELGYPYWPKPKPGLDDVTDAEIAAWVAEDPRHRAFVRPGVQKALAFLEQFNPARRKAVAP